MRAASGSAPVPSEVPVVQSKPQELDKRKDGYREEGKEQGTPAPWKEGFPIGFFPEEPLNEHMLGDSVYDTKNRERDQGMERHEFEEIAHKGPGNLAVADQEWTPSCDRDGRHGWCKDSE